MTKDEIIKLYKEGRTIDYMAKEYKLRHDASQRMLREKNDRISMTLRDCRRIVVDTIIDFNNKEFKKTEGL